MKKSQLPELGTVNDRKRRVNDARKDDEPTRTAVQEVRDWIYKRAYGIKSMMVERVISVQSMVPTLVCGRRQSETGSQLTFFVPERLLPSQCLRSQYLCHVGRRLHA